METKTEIEKDKLKNKKNEDKDRQGRRMIINPESQKDRNEAKNVENLEKCF